MGSPLLILVTQHLPFKCVDAGRGVDVRLVKRNEIKPEIPTVNFEWVGLFSPGHIIVHSRQKKSGISS